MIVRLALDGGQFGSQNGHAMHDRTSRLAAVVKSRRKRLGLRQEEAAALAGLSTRFVHMVEAGKSSVRLDKLLELLGALGLNLTVTQGAPGVHDGTAATRRMQD